MTTRAKEKLSPGTGYLLFRLILPGVCCTALGGLLVTLHRRGTISEVISLDVLLALSLSLVASGPLLHYVIDYPRRRRRFRAIEDKHGPIARVSEMAAELGLDLDRRRIEHLYFSLLNDEIPPQTRERVYYFSSVYLFLGHLGLLLLIFGVANLVFSAFSTNPFSGLSLHVALSSGATAGWHLLMRKGGRAENYLVRMFDIQTAWIGENADRVRSRLVLLTTSGGKHSSPATAQETEIENIEAKQRYEALAPKVFISYSHDSDRHKAWVLRLAEALRKEKGIDVLLDQWEPLGTDLTAFMEQGIQRSTRVLVVCTPTYVLKANERKGGVGYEGMIISGELASQIQTNKFIFALRKGTFSDSLPTFAKTKKGIDFRDDLHFEERLDELARDILGKPLRGKPAIGKASY